MKAGHRFLCFLIVCLMALPAFSSRLAPSTTYAIHTTYFTINYPAESIKVAQELSRVCDSLYEEACQSLNVQPWMKNIPISITTATDDQNAYYTGYTANKIVLYDTPFSTPLASCFSDGIIDVFTHELFHLVSLNLKTPFLKAVDTVLGDSYTPVYFVTASSVIEGSAVRYESRNGEGRLNSPHYQALLLKAKAEGKFPSSYLDITGIRDTDPSGDLTYTFSATFLDYVAKRFGEDAYNHFVSLCNKMVLPVDFTVWFADAFGVGLQQVWNDFKETIPTVTVTPNVLSSPLKDDLLLAPGVTVLKRDGMIHQDGKNCYTQSSIRSVDRKGDQLLVVSEDSSFTTRSSLVLYQDKKKTMIDGQNVLDAVFCGDGIAKLSHRSSAETLTIDDVPYAMPFPLYELTSSDNDSLYALAQIGKTMQIVHIEKDGSYTAYALPDGVVPYTLEREKEGTLFFSWVKRGTFRRLGLFDPASGTFALMNQDCRGGIDRAVYYDGQVVVQNSLFDHRELSVLNVDALTFTTVDAVVTSGSLQKEEEGKIEEGENEKGSNPSLEQPLLKASFLPYIMKGTIYPVINTVEVSDSLVRSTSLAVGAFRVSGDPYDDWKVMYGVGYDLFAKKGIAAAEATGYLRPVNGTWILDSMCMFDGSFWLRGKLSSTYKHLTVASQTEYFGKTGANTALLENFSLSYSTLRLKRHGSWSQGGFSLTPTLSYLQKFGDSHQLNLSVVFKYSIPGLLFWWDSPTMTYNLPLRFVTTLTPSSTVKLSDGSSAPVFLQEDISAVLFSTEIQKGLPYIHLYVWRFTLEAGYQCVFADSHDRGDFPIFQLADTIKEWDGVSTVHTCSLSAFFSMTSNNRVLALSSGKLGATLSYTIGRSAPWSVTFSYKIFSLI